MHAEVTVKVSCDLVFTEIIAKMNRTVNPSFKPSYETEIVRKVITYVS